MTSISRFSIIILKHTISSVRLSIKYAFAEIAQRKNLKFSGKLSPDSPVLKFLMKIHTVYKLNKLLVFGVLRSFCGHWWCLSFINHIFEIPILFSTKHFTKGPTALKFKMQKEVPRYWLLAC